MGRSAQRILVSTGLITLILAGGGLLGRYVSPQAIWWLQILAEGLPVLAAALLISAILLVLSGKYALALIQLLAIAVVVARDLPTIETHEPSERPELSLRLMTLNAKPKYDAPPESLVDILMREDIDAVGIQEASISYFSRPRLLAAPLIIQKTLGAYHTNAFHAAQDSVEHVPVPILSRIPQSDHATIHLVTSSGRELAIGQSTFQWCGHDVVIYNLHLLSYHDLTLLVKGAALVQLTHWMVQISQIRSDILQRAEEARALRQFLDQEVRPFVVIGDFNSTIHSWAYAHISRGLHSASYPYGLLVGTYHARLPLFRVDHILASPHWEIIQAKSLETNFSDHRAVIAHLVLRAEADAYRESDGRREATPREARVFFEQFPSDVRLLNPPAQIPADLPARVATRIARPSYAQ